MHADLWHGGGRPMLDDLRRKLEIGSHGERLRTVRELGKIDTRDAYELLELAVEDIDPQIQEEATRAMRESVWCSGSPGRSSAPVDDVPDEQESFF